MSKDSPTTYGNTGNAYTVSHHHSIAKASVSTDNRQIINAPDCITCRKDRLKLPNTPQCKLICGSK
jgi:queuine/archaeosine tRNA-ribosyltransferase